MNRKERRRLSKQLGIMQHQKSLSREEKFNLVRENILTGKEQHKQFVDEMRRVQNLSKEEKESEEINILAKQIEKSENISLSSALEKAQEIYYKKRR